MMTAERIQNQKKKTEIHFGFLNCLQIEREGSVCQSNFILVLQRLHCIRAHLSSSYPNSE
jgi:hypothetical protein